MGDVDVTFSGVAESTMRHHTLVLGNLTCTRDPGRGPWQPVSFTGAVSSQRVTEEREGWLSAVGNRVSSVWAQASLTVRPTSRADTKVGPSDPAVECGIAVAQRIKGTLGITG